MKFFRKLGRTDAVIINIHYKFFFLRKQLTARSSIIKKFHSLAWQFHNSLSEFNMLGTHSNFKFYYFLWWERKFYSSLVHNSSFLYKKNLLYLFTYFGYFFLHLHWEQVVHLPYPLKLLKGQSISGLNI